MARFLEKLADDGFGQHLDMNPSVSRTFTMSVAMDNAAFEAGDLDSEEELPRLIKEVASRVASGEASGIVMDINGNKVGTFEIA